MSVRAEPPGDDCRARSLRRRTQRSEVLRRKVMERGGWAETPSLRSVSGRYRDTTSSTPATTTAEQPIDQSVSVSSASR